MNNVICERHKGGCVNTYTCTVMMTKCTFNNNENKQGGAVLVSKQTRLSANNMICYNNTAVDVEGGCLYIDKGSVVTMTNSKILHNYGSGVYCGDIDGLVIQAGVDIRENVPEQTPGCRAILPGPSDKPSWTMIEIVLLSTLVILFISGATVCIIANIRKKHLEESTALLFTLKSKARDSNGNDVPSLY